MSRSSEIDSYLIQARSFIDNLEFGDAQDAIVSALNVDANYAPAYELLGEVFAEQEQQPNARVAFTKAIELDAGSLDATTGFEKYLWMGQLCETGGEQSIAYYRTGVKRLIAAIAATTEADQPPMRARLASAYSAMAELYMTDLCMTENAEEQCEKYVTNALLADDRSSEALQTLASMRLSQSRVEDAKTTLANSMSIWKDQVPGAPGFPTYASRLSLVRLLLECEMTEDALEVLQQLEHEVDEVVDLWFLFGWTYYLQGEAHAEASEERKESWEDARDCLHRCEKLYRRLDWNDEALKEHASDLLGNINAAGISIEHKDEPDQEPQANGDIEEEDWESDEDEMDEN
ncbi:TPR domain protein [Taphrina deformans PYCC 5710]|uniref:TPR domain protein n=1 Tax=Taphrina deformans (strain PYCC 5710 / ATCC 11124 / CBS 356.35 / IMI 108563 / JCM 9778 / NBRC 8474) TaxID=1097556 RepID=R4XFQ7_TAPDE|nr:TPR domain protein [Taphrina deformans PYCC 5710]|eukprot:CCG82187.1 TPR domain protein [Taphrina deformans PYCC 5710]